MATNFSSLPIIDLAPLSEADVSEEALQKLSAQLYDVFATVGFAYLINPPLTFSHNDVFNIAKEFFGISLEEKMKLAKKIFVKENENTYRGYFPAQPGSDNLKEGLEIGPFADVPRSSLQSTSSVDLTEPNIFPPATRFPSQAKLPVLYDELQKLSHALLSLLGSSLGKPPTAFTSYHHHSVSTLRLLHYPSIQPPKPQQELNCTPHTDSGLLTLLHQDPTGGLEVLNSQGEWIPAPYVPGSLVVNIGDLMAHTSGDRFVATYHRVRSSPGKERYSIPFFFEPGVDAMVGAEGKEVRYEEFVLRKMSTWVEFQDVKADDGFPTEEGTIGGSTAGEAVAVA